MATMVGFVLFYLLFPGLVLYLCHRFPALDKVGAAALCFVFGMILANVGVMPGNLTGIQKNIMSITIPFAIPLMLFQMDLKRWWRLAGVTLWAFLLFIIALLITTAVGFYIMKGYVDEADKIGAMSIAGFTGATVNFMGVAMALKAKSETIVVTTAVMWLQEIFWLLFMMYLGQRVIGLILPSFRKSNVSVAADSSVVADVTDRERQDISNYKGIFTRQKAIPLAKAFAVAFLIFGVSFALYSVTPQEHNMTVLMLSVSTLGLLCSFVPAIRKIDMSFQLGQYLILIFCITIASTVNFNELLNASSGIMLYVFIILFGSTVLHIVFCRLCKIDTDTQIVTSTVGIFSAVFVPMIALSLKNRDIIPGGIAAGIIGYVIGTYLGVVSGYLLKIFV